MTQSAISVAATFTAEPLGEVFHFWMARLGLPVRLVFSGYNQVFQELANPQSAAAAAGPGASVFLLRIEDWARDQADELAPGAMTQAAREFIALFQNFAGRARRPVILFICPFSPAVASNPELRMTVTSLQNELKESLGDLRDVAVIGADDVEALYPVAVRDDVLGDHEGHIPFTREYFAALATILARRIRVITSPPYKVLVVDGDNTLWDGVVGEVGSSQVQFPPERQALHRFLLARKQKGMLLALASKNESPDVEAVLARPESILKREDFVGWKVNWEPKSRNISHLARELELGLNSFIFLDDNPVECAEVEANCAQVTALVLPSISAEIPHFMNHVWACDLSGGTAVDEKRTELYRQQGERNQFRQHAISFSEFISGLQLEVVLASPEPRDYERAAQLSERTNQFNASGVRWKPSQLGSMLDSGSRSAFLVRVRDRFGDYGEVGFAVFYLERDNLIVENLLLSCRVLGKGVEHQVVSALGREALKRGAASVFLSYRATERNRPAERFLKSLGATQEFEGFRLPTALALGVSFEPADDAGLEEMAEATNSSVSGQLAIDFRSIAGELRSVEQIRQTVDRSLRRARPDLPNACILPRNSLEASLARIWEDVLHIDVVGVTDSFFSLGGQSLQAAGVASRIATELGIRLSIGTVLAAPTIEALCEQTTQAGPAGGSIHALPRGVEAKLSQAQQRLWFLDQFIPYRAAYNIPVARRISGVVDRAALEAALAAVALRHDTLRSTVDANGQLHISGAAAVRMEWLAVASEAAAFKRADGEARHLFDLAGGPLMRCAVISWGPSDHLFVLNLHHIVSDGWSMGIVLREIAHVYSAALEGRRPVWKPLAASYGDYAAWQENRAGSAAAQADLAYWKAELTGAPSLLDLPFDKPRPSSMTYVGGTIFDRAPDALRSGVESLAARTRCTPFMIMLAAWQALLYRYSRQDDIVVGTPVAGRSMTELEGLVGCFVNTLAIRTQVEGASPFLDYLQVVRNKILNGLDHQELPFEQLVNELNLKRDLSRSPLFQVMFVLQSSSDGDFSPTGLQVVPVNIHNGGAKFDVLLEVTPVRDGYSLMLEFNSSLFSEMTAARILRHFIRFLEAACTAPETAVDSLTMMDNDEIRQVLELAEGDTSIAVPETTLQAMFEAQVARTPDAPAISFGAASLSYRELNERANHLAHYLRRLGVGPQVLVGVFVERSIEMVVGLYGILKAGGAYVPIDPEYPTDRVEFMVRDAAPQVLLIQEKLENQVPSSSAVIVRLDRDWPVIQLESAENPTGGSTPCDPAYMIYTSGSTGMPKGALNSHRGICNRLVWMQSAYGLTPSDTVLQKTPFSFDVSVWEFFWPLQVGARLAVAKPGGHRESSYLVDVIKTERVTVLHFVPSMLGAFLADPDAGECTSLRHVVCSGEALPFQLQEQFFAILPAQLHNLYGPTEAAVDVTHWSCRRNSMRSIVPIGRPVANTQIYILDHNRKPVPAGVAGELYIGGVQVGLGYHNRPDLTAERFVKNEITGRPGERMYRTGDLARYLQEGEVEYLGRLDHQVKIRGFRIELGEIEATLLKHDAIQEAVVVAREDQPGTKRLVAYVVSAASAVDASELRDHLKKTLPEYMVPTAFVFLERLPLSPNGKIDRKLLPAPLYRPEHSIGFEAARTPVERKVAELWSKVLHSDRIGIHDNFFELGGDSILSIQLISLGRREGLQLTAAMLFANQTIAELAAAVEGAVQPVIEAAVDATRGSLPLTPIQCWFFAQNLDQPHYYNQAFLFEVTEPLNRATLERAAGAVSQHHDGLRLRFERQAGGWQQRYGSPEENVSVDWIPLATLSEPDQRHAIEAMAASTQGSLNLETGPLWRIVYFDLGVDRRSRLLFVVHHLAVDGVSWRPLLEDLETAYQQLLSDGRAQLPSRTSSFKAWAERLESYAHSEKLQCELPYWQALADPAATRDSLLRMGAAPTSQQNKEGSAVTVKGALSFDETRDLLQRAPTAYNTQINDLLLTALARSWALWSGSPVLFTNLEGHGREPLFDDVDVSRTVGWFTSIFPVRLELDSAASTWKPGEALMSVKEQLRRVPGRGIGFGLLRYLGAEKSLQDLPMPQIVFNYFGQIDQLLKGSEMFRFAAESEGAWHSPLQTRSHRLEFNCMVIHGRFELRCTFSPDLHAEEKITGLVAKYVQALQELILHCLSPDAGRRTPSDFPLARLDQATLDHLTANGDCEDIYPLAPIQTLFLSSDRGGASASLDQWHCTLDGVLDVEHFRAAWASVLARHPILRSTIHSSEDLSEPLQVVHRHVNPAWSIEDWREDSAAPAQARWEAFLEQDRSQFLKLTDPPLMRFALRRIGERRWKFVWSVPALLLDGWSWPLVFSEVSQCYGSLQQNTAAPLAATRPYRDYISWLKQQDPERSRIFWRKAMDGFVRPTPLPLVPASSRALGDRYRTVVVDFTAAMTAGLQETARRLRVTFSSLVQGAWAILLHRQSGGTDVVFGASFSGRPADLPGAATIVGPFVNNLPVRVHVKQGATLDSFFRGVHARTLELSLYQFTPLVEIQAATEVPWRYRLFDSLVVFQNYLVDDSARRFGDGVEISEFAGPVHTNFPLLLLADPGQQLRLSLIYDREQVAAEMAERWGKDLTQILAETERESAQLLTNVLGTLSAPEGRSSDKPRHVEDEGHFIPPQDEMEKTIGKLWQTMFGLDRISMDANFFDLGGHSLLLVQIHTRLEEVLKTRIPIVSMLEHPNVRSLARHLNPGGNPATQSEQWRKRAAKQREALGLRPVPKR